MGYIVKKPINGIAANGYHFLLDDKNSIIMFETIEDAIKLLKENGIDQKDFEDFGIKIEEYDAV